MRGSFIKNSIIYKLQVKFISFIICIYSPCSYSWKTVEHEYLGSASYKAACNELMNGHELTFLQKNQLEKLACNKNLFLSQRYGRFTALSGDYLKSPDEFSSNVVLGLNNTNDFLNFALLALKNEEHFHPSVKSAWRKYHLAALKLAVKNETEWGSQSTSNHHTHPELTIEKKQRFLKSLYANAFSDHFLHDSFSSGHIGINRVSASPAISHYLHDKGNEDGKLVTNGLGDVWITFGDGRLLTEEKKVIVKNATHDNTYIDIEFIPNKDFKILHFFKLYSIGLFKSKDLKITNINSTCSQHALKALRASTDSVKSFLYAFFTNTINTQLEHAIEENLITGYLIIDEPDINQDAQSTPKSQIIKRNLKLKFSDVSNFEDLKYFIFNVEFGYISNFFNESKYNSQATVLNIGFSTNYIDGYIGLNIHNRLKINEFDTIGSMTFGIRSPRLYYFPSFFSYQLEISHENLDIGTKIVVEGGMDITNIEAEGQLNKAGIRINAEKGKNFLFISFGLSHLDLTPKANLARVEANGQYIQVGYSLSF